MTTKLTLHFVLHVSKLACNLLPVIKISNDANCHVVFCESHCTFQNHNSGETIGRAKMIGGFCYFDEVSVSYKIAQGLSNGCSIKETIMLRPPRLGHPNFFYLKYLFPILFRDLESCIFAEHHRSTYLPNSYKASSPFYLIYTDVWGHLKFKTPSGKRWFVTFINDHSFNLALSFNKKIRDKKDFCLILQYD